MTGVLTRGRDENKTKASLLHRRRRRPTGTTILYCILENDIPLLVKAVESAQEKPAVFDPHQHPAKQ